jgi:ubiquinone/menaquinone biosynthesis C-methylase UbiE
MARSGQSVVWRKDGRNRRSGAAAGGGILVDVAHRARRASRLISLRTIAMTSDATTPPAPDLAAVKARQQVAWSTGNYAVVGTTLQIVGEQLCESMDLRSGTTVLDVAAGNGNASLAAARRWCNVTSTDYVASLLDAGRARAQADGLTIAFQEADAEQLPFADGSFDHVVSTFGVMFTPNQGQAAAEMARVCKSGGRIGLANWTPDSFIGQLFKIIGQYVPPAPGMKSPSLWGTQARIKELFADSARDITFTQREFVFRYRSPVHWIEVFRTFYGPMNKTFAALDADRQAAFTEDLLQLMARGNRATDGTLVLPSAYLEIVIDRR